MTVMIAKGLLAYFLAAAVPPAAVSVCSSLAPVPADDDEGCSGCAAHTTIQPQTWKTAGSPPVPMWDNGGNIVTSQEAGDNVNTKKKGRCKIKQPPEGEEVGECEMDTDDPCNAERVVVIQQLPVGHDKVNGTSFTCRLWTAATADQKKLVAHVTECGVGPMEDTFESHPNTSQDCQKVLTQSQRIIITAKCDPCVYSGSEDPEEGN